MPRKSASLKNIPVIPLRGITVFPKMTLHFDVGRPLSIAALENAMAQDQMVLLVTQKEAGNEDPTVEDIYSFGTYSKIRQVLNLPGGNIRVLAEGEKRASIRKIRQQAPYWSADLSVYEPDRTTFLDMKIRSGRRLLQDLFEEYAAASQRISPDMLQSIAEVRDDEEYCDLLAANTFLDVKDKQGMLEEKTVMGRIELLVLYLMREVELLKTEQEMQTKFRERIDKNQKEYYLREQLHAIQDELGDGEEADYEEIRLNIESLPLSEEVRQKCLKELERMRHMAPGSPDIGVSRTYLEWITDMPWGKYTQDNLNIKYVRKKLDADHYAMEKVKERMIEYLAVCAMRKINEGDTAMKGPILCLVGPPGVGKTSIVRSVADALGRKFVQMSLGGVRDEAEIRGHRRTYIGAIPGRIISGMKQAGTMNPLFLLDEVDKMGNDFRGDPSSAMLEVLDSEQNFAFQDHYLEIPFDLSKVMFITTANSTESIPAPLLDRMEIIEVPSYTEEEKLQIATRHLLKKQLKENGVPQSSVRIPTGMMKKIIEDYTREAGVRQLERTIAQVVRKAAVQMLEEGTSKVQVTENILRRYLGGAKFLREPLEKKPAVGVVNGLAYTTVGGEMLAVECSALPGTGQILLTGQLGDVMKESAKAAQSYVRAHAAKYQIDGDFYKNRDLHIHVPEGAVPKDGPSAGVTMVTALVSALSDAPVRQDVAMTGEITLRGRVLPIGGVKEKFLAAYRAGIKTVILPSENKKDLEEIPDYILSSFQICFVSRIDEVLVLALNQ